MTKAASYTQIYIQLVFATRNRNAFLREEIRPAVFSYISGIIKEMKHKPLTINGMHDHVHIFLGLNPNVSISDTIRDIKRASTLYINSNHLSPYKFEWQNGYGAFSYGRSQVDNVYRYIMNQQEHHRKRTFREEYIEFLRAFDIEYKEEFLFEFFEDS